MAGLWKQELENLAWTDVDFKAGTIGVSPKDGSDPKDWEQRTIEVPDELLHILKSLPRKNRFVFANTRGNKYTHSWDDCAVIGKKAGMAGAHPHKFRATYATTPLHSGVDLKTVQKLPGHKRLESTMRYLAKAESPKVSAKVNAVKFGAPHPIWHDRCSTLVKTLMSTPSSRRPQRLYSPSRLRGDLFQVLSHGPIPLCGALSTYASLRRAATWAKASTMRAWVL